jgi:hypothetical protein
MAAGCDSRAFFLCLIYNSQTVRFIILYLANSKMPLSGIASFLSFFIPASINDVPFFLSMVVSKVRWNFVAVAGDVACYDIRVEPYNNAT